MFVFCQKGKRGPEFCKLIISQFFFQLPYLFFLTNLDLRALIEEKHLDRNFGHSFLNECFRHSLVQEEASVQSLIDACIQDDDKLYLCVSSPTIKDKPVQIRPWRLSDADFVLDASLPLDPRKTVFVGGVPRPLKAGKKVQMKIQ